MHATATSLPTFDHQDPIDPCLEEDLVKMIKVFYLKKAG